MMMLISALTVLLVLGLAGILLLGIYRAALRARLDGGPRRITTRFAIGIAGWLALTAIVAKAGFFSDFASRPPHLMMGVVGALLLFTFTTRSKTATRLLAVMPLTWPILIHSMRIVVELGLWGLYEQGQLPKHLTFEGRNFDVLVGLTAPVVAFALSRKWIGTKVLIGWNIASICVLANIVIMAITSIPGPLHLDSWPGPANTIVAEFPYVWLPTFLVPVALFGHIVSLRQILGLCTAQQDEEPLGRRSRESSKGQLSER
jgi:hypothetical protein